MARITPTRAVTLLLLALATFIYFSFGADEIADKLDDAYSFSGWRDPQASAHSETGDGLEYAPDGLVHGWDAAYDRLRTGGGGAGLSKREKTRLAEVVKRHPIEVLMERGKQQWEALLARQSKTLPQAIIRYKQRYGREPPKGFEQWYKFARRNGVKIVDDYDQIHKDIEPWFGIKPEVFRKRADKLHAAKFSYRITLDPNNVTLSGERHNAARGRLLLKLVAPLAPLLPTLPDGSPIAFQVSDHDVGGWIPGADQILALKQAASEGRFLDEDDLAPFEKQEGRSEVKGLLSACPVDSAGYQYGIGREVNTYVPIPDKQTTFLYDPVASFDYCNQPWQLSLHGFTSRDWSHDTILRPIFQLSKAPRSNDFLTTPLEAYTNASDPKAADYYLPWDQKTDSRLFWRGGSTGDSYSARKGYDWRRSHRPRLHLMAQAQEEGGSRDVWVQRGREWVRESWAVKKLNEKYMDVGLVGRPHQCATEETCQEMRDEIQFKDRVDPSDSPKYKYAFDIDGNGWSSRFYRLLLSGSVVLKSTIYPEWYQGNLIPWYHYVPVQIDYTDIYSIMSYFVGPPDGKSGGHDDAARRIAENGRQFALEHWRWVDMQAYMYRILLEYARLHADDRDAWTIYKTY